MIKVGSDFSGVGAFNQALTRLGIEYDEIFACDMDKFARQTFIHNYGEPKYYPENVYDREIPSESLDIYMTSPPCQAFSLAGKRLGKDDKRGILFFNSHEFIKKNKPRYFIFENVKGLLSDDNGRTFGEWIRMLGGKSVDGLPVLFSDNDSVPYHIYSKVLNAKNHGVPQNRERVFIVGIRDDVDNDFRWPKEEQLNKKLKDVLESDVDKKYFLTYEMIKKIIKNPDYNELNSSLKINSATSKGSQLTNDHWIADFRKDEGLQIRKDNISPYMTTSDVPFVGDDNDKNWIRGGLQEKQKHKSDGISPCLTSAMGLGGGHTPFHNYQGKIRRLTPRECFRLMDFPDSFTWPVSDSQAYKQAGNSIVVGVLEKIIEKFNL